MNFELPYFQSNSYSRNPVCKYLAKSEMEIMWLKKNVVKFRVVNKEILIMLIVLY